MTHATHGSTEQALSSHNHTEPHLAMMTATPRTTSTSTAFPYVDVGGRALRPGRLPGHGRLRPMVARRQRPGSTAPRQIADAEADPLGADVPRIPPR